MIDIAVPREKTLFNVNMSIAIVIWFFIIVGTFGIGLLYCLSLYIGFLFVHSALIAHIKGNCVLITPEQFPDLYGKVDASSRKLMMPTPKAYLMNGNGVFNAFATRFMRQHYVVLYSNVVDAFERSDAPIDFYIGHELGHIHRDHLRYWPIFAPVAMFPLLWPAYRRACEYTCDQYGKFCSPSTEAATQGLALLAAGGTRWSTLSAAQFMQQNQDTRGFWMSFHELTGTYPWLSKRVAMIQGDVVEVRKTFPKRNKFSYVLALFCPGFLTGAYLPILLIYFAVILSLVAIPAVSAFKAKTASAKAAAGGQSSKNYSTTQNTYQGSSQASSPTPSQPAAQESWVNPVTGSLIELPSGFYNLRLPSNASFIKGVFTNNQEVLVEQVIIETMARSVSLRNYVAALKVSKEKAIKLPVQSPTFSKIDGIEVGELVMDAPAAADGKKYQNTSYVWCLDGVHFWQLISTVDTASEVGKADAEKFVRAFVSKTK